MIAEERREQDVAAGYRLFFERFRGVDAAMERASAAEALADLLAAARAEAVAPYVERERAALELARNWHEASPNRSGRVQATAMIRLLAEGHR